MTNVTKIKTGNYIIDGVIIFIICISLLLYNNENIINKLYDLLIKKNSSMNKIILESTDKTSSQKFKGLMHFINNNCIIKEYKEYEFKKYDWSEILTINAGFKVNQIEEFNITKEIKGIVVFKNKEKTENDKKINEEVLNLEIYSNTIDTKLLINFINECEKSYLIYMKQSIIQKKLIIDILWNEKDKCIEIESSPWVSNVSFKNRFFDNKDKILQKINFFLNNKEWYKQKGIPHTLGLLLWGEPGCGKTSFIKALANHEKCIDKHIINIKLSSQFDLIKLNKIIFNEEINSNLIIPLDKRIIVFEDIDCMDNIVNQRKNNDDDDDEKNKEFEKILKKEELEKILLSTTYKNFLKPDINSNNNLSNLLNIFDGIKESSERFIIATTNCPEKLDKAFRRKGRFDDEIYFKYASSKDIYNMLCDFWDVESTIIPLTWSYLLPHSDITNYCKSSTNIEETIKFINDVVTVTASNKDIIKIINTFWNSKINEIKNINDFILTDIVHICQTSKNIEDAIKKIEKNEFT